MEFEKKKVIAVDLDGTLAHYDGWKGVDHIGEPIPRMVDAVWNAHSKGHKVVLFTARANDKESITHIFEWLALNNIPITEITHIKRKEFTHFWDDRALGVVANTGMFKLDNATAAKSNIKDTGAHYRYEYNGVKLDPARICKVYGITNILQGAIIKKTLRAGERGHKDIVSDIDDIMTALVRWKEMVMEDKE